MKEQKQKRSLYYLLLGGILLGICLAVYVIGRPVEIEPNKFNKLYEVENSQYILGRSYLVDTYLIASAVYFNFESYNLIAEENKLHQAAKE